MRYRDFEEFLESLNASEARYLVVGAHAVAFHAPGQGRARLTSHPQDGEGRHP
jgi:hypothetical protein